MEHQPIIITRAFNTSPERLWNAITDKDEMKKWYFDLKEFRAEPGFEFEFTGGHEDGVQYIHHCEVTEAIPQKSITYSWSYVGYDGKSFVTWELFAEGDKTVLRLTHSKLETFPQGVSDFAKQNFVEGWNHIINTGLKTHLET